MIKNLQIIKDQIILRPPVVAVMGHVDHGKTSILDYIRKTNVAVKENGGITQHIGAYQIKVPQPTKLKIPKAPDKITFIDTQGHEAFAKMRSRGANAADIAVLVVAANDGVKPQTLESIEHIKNANIISIAVINKIDLPSPNAELIKKQLSKAGLKLEEYGGDIPLVKISAKTGEGIDKLLETIIFLTDLYQFKKDNNSAFQGIVIESSLSKFKGVIATVVVKHGNLKVSETIATENQLFKVRALQDWQGKGLSEVNPGDAAEFLGWKSLPQVGSLVYKKEETGIINEPQKAPDSIKQKPLMKVSNSDNKDNDSIKLIIKADTWGTLEAIVNGLSGVEIIHKGVGEINESDILLAKTSKSIVIGFNQKLSQTVIKLAQSEKVLIKTYEIIYKLFEEIKDVIAAIRKGDLVETLGEATVLAKFDFKNETVIGAKVIKGRIAKGDKVNIKRNDEIINKNRIRSLKHFKEEITKAELGMEIGIGLAQKSEILTGDSIISIG